MTLLKDNNYKDINVALLSLEADIKNKITGFDTSEIDKQLAEINSRIDKINAGNSSDEIEDINSKLNINSVKIKNIEQNIEDIDTQINDIEQKLSDIFSAENKVTDFNTTTTSGIYYWIDDATNRPSNYGVLLVNKYDGGIWVNQVAYGTNNKIYFRQNINSGNWTEWKAVAFDGELTAKKVANALTVNGKTYDGSSAVNAGVQTVANGGTGVTTQADINKAFINNLEVGNYDVTDGTEFVSSWANDNGFSEPRAVNKPYRRKFIKVWNYIKGKISSVLGLTKDTYGGKASTAGNADKVDNYHASELWRSDGATWNPKANVSLNAAANGDEWSFDIHRNGKTGCYWHVWDENKSTLLKVNADDGKVSAPYGFVGNLSGKAAKSSFLDEYVGAGGTRPTSGNIKPKDATEYGGMRKDVVTSSMTDSGRPSMDGHLLTMFWDNTGRYDSQFFVSNDNPPVLKARGKENASDYGPWVDVITGNNAGRKLVLQGDTVSSNSYQDANPKLEFKNNEGSQNISLTFTDFDAVQAPASLTLNGNQGNEYFIAPNIKATGKFYGNLSGNASTATSATNDGNGNNIANTYMPKSGGTFTGAVKASNKIVIPIGTPSSLEDGCIWIS